MRQWREVRLKSPQPSCPFQIPDLLNTCTEKELRVTSSWILTLDIGSMDLAILLLFLGPEKVRMISFRIQPAP